MDGLGALTQIKRCFVCKQGKEAGRLQRRGMCPESAELIRCDDVRTGRRQTPVQVQPLLRTTLAILIYILSARSLVKLFVRFTLRTLLLPALLFLLLPLYLYLARRPGTAVPTHKYPAAMALKSVVIPAKQAHTATVIFSHGLGDTGHGWTFLAEQLGSSFPYVKWCFPHAPMRPITLNGGHKMPGWFDIR